MENEDFFLNEFILAQMLDEEDLHELIFAELGGEFSLKDIKTWYGSIMSKIKEKAQAGASYVSKMGPKMVEGVLKALEKVGLDGAGITELKAALTAKDTAKIKAIVVKAVKVKAIDTIIGKLGSLGIDCDKQ